MTAQVRRAAVSIPANIAEGIGRGTSAEAVRFARIAQGSVYELDTLLHLATDVCLSRPDATAELRTRLSSLARRISTFVRYKKTRRQGSGSPTIHDPRSAKMSLSAMISATQLRPGMVIKFNGELFSIFSVLHRTPGNLRGFVQAKMRNLRSGSMIEHRFSSEDRVERAALEQHRMEYLYDDGEYYHFMDSDTFEQMHLTRDLLGDAIQYLTPQLGVTVEFFEGKPISVALPATVDLTVVETDPSLRGATVSNVTKPAKLETGLVVQVPPFVNQGDRIRVSTAEGAYQERV